MDGHKFSGGQQQLPRPEISNIIALAGLTLNVEIRAVYWQEFGVTIYITILGLRYDILQRIAIL